MKKLMILGAGIYQVPLIKTAKRLGFHTIVCSIPGEWPGFAEADQVYEINTTDRRRILDVAENEGIAGICTTGTDVAVASIGFVNDKMHLSGVSQEAAYRASDKYIMQQHFHQYGVSSANYEKAESFEEVKNAAKRFGFPVVVKCVDSSGNRGITIVNHVNQLRKAWEEAHSRFGKGYCIVEEKLNGVEFGIDGIIQNGEIKLLLPHQKLVCERANTRITAGHIFPYICNRKTTMRIRKEIETAIEATGFNNCAFNADAFADGENVSIIEIGGRAGATCIPELINMHTGVDYYEKIIHLAVGQPVVFSYDQANRPCFSHLVFSPVNGVITDINEMKTRELKESGIQIAMDYNTGHAVDAVMNGTHRIGQVLAPVSTEKEIEEIMCEVYKCISVNGENLNDLWGVDNLKEKEQENGQ